MSPELRWYPDGLGEPDNVEVKPLMGDVNAGDVAAAIDKLYLDCLVTPVSLPLGGLSGAMPRVSGHVNMSSLSSSLT